MNLYADFTFDRAGQGLFYHGQIQGEGESFTVVYDCGTSNRIKGANRNLSKVIQNNFNSENRIGLLAISHFDLDHVSHIPELLKKNKVDTVMLPYVAKAIRAVFFAKSVSETWTMNTGTNQEFNPDLALLFKNPEEYFLENGEARQIIVIRGDDSDNKDEPIEPDNSTINENPLLQHVSGGRFFRNGITDRCSVYCGSPVYRAEINELSWLFKPLNVQEKLSKKFYKDVDKIIARYNNDWRDLLSDATAIKELTKIYDCHIDGRRHRNTHSLLLRHEPEQYSGLTATVLLGDLKLNGKAKEVLSKYKFLDKTGVVLIPHHGADSGDLLWLDKETRNDCVELVVSYGIKNTYKHPSFIHDGKLLDIRNTIFFVNEKKKFQYRIYI